MSMLPRTFFERDTRTVARELLGMHLVRRDRRGRPMVGRIVETEAYLGGHDRASHSSRGMTRRNRTMFGPPGHAYIYLVYGMHHCMNVVTEPAGHGAAVLLRALEPVKNISGRTQGPALLCQAMGLERSLDGHDLVHADFHIASAEPQESFSIVGRPRIGIDSAGPRWARRLLRFYIRHNQFVSKP